MTLAVFGSTTAVLLTNYIIQFHRIRPWLRPSLALAERTTAVRLLRTGCLFLCLQMLAFLHTSVDNILVARFQGVACVPAYAVVQKIALLLLVVPQAGAAPLWAAFGDAVAHTDRDWIGRTLVQSVIAAGVYGAVAGCLLAVMGKSVIVWWLNGTVHAEPGVLAGFGVYIFVSAIALPLSSLASTSGLLRWNVLYSGLAILSAFGLKLWSLSTGSTSGVIWVMSPCLLVLYVLPLSYRLVRRPLIVR